MSDPQLIFTQENLNKIFPAERTDAFFEALFGDPDEGAYDIVLSFDSARDNKFRFLFELHRRGDACLACNLTHGLPAVFMRHKVINLNGVVNDLAKLAGWEEGTWTWKLGSTAEVSYALHVIPLTLIKN